MVLILSGIFLQLCLFLLLLTSATITVCTTIAQILFWFFKYSDSKFILSWFRSSQHWQWTWRQNTDQTDRANISGPVLQCLHCHKLLCISPLWWGHTGWRACQLWCKSWHPVQLSLWWYSASELCCTCHACLSHCLLCPSAQLGWIALPYMEAHFLWQ